MNEILEKARHGRRLTRAEALDLALNAPIHDLGEAALAVRNRLYGDKAFYVYNQHVNYTNICKNACRFCAYSKRKGEAGGYVQSVDDVAKAVEKRLAEPVRELHIVGGLNPDLPYDYYLDLLRRVKQVRPQAGIKAFTAVEYAFLADQNGLTVDQVLKDMRQAGLDAVPGGGAEVFNPELRKKLCPEKISGERWLDVHRTAHGLGIKTNCTILFGHIETWEHRLEHLENLRDLQDETGGFACFIPLPYQPENNPLGKQAKGPDGNDFLRMMAISRLFLDNIPHLKAYWVFSGMKPAQLALWAGADDLDGTLVEEKIGHAAGAKTPTGMTVPELENYIRSAGFTPVQRDTFFSPVV